MTKPNIFQHIFYLIRAFVFYIVMAISILLGVAGILLMTPFPFAARFGVIRVWSKFMAFSCRWICGLRYELIGEANIKNPPFIIFSKHQSAWETIVFSGLFPKNCFITKKELLYIPIFGWAFGLAKHIPIDRSQGIRSLKKVTEIGKKRLDAGISIILFPEGTRVSTGEDPKFHAGGAALVKGTGSKIVPVAHNAGQFWRRNSFIKIPGKITVIVGEPIDTTGMSAKEINRISHEWMVKNMAKIEG